METPKTPEYVKELEAKLEKILDIVLLLDENQIDSEAALEEISDIVWPGRFGSWKPFRSGKTN